MSGKGYIEAKPPQRCELCKEVAETRPYGPNGENVCFPCGMKDEAAAKDEPCECYATGDYPCRVCAGAKDETKCD